MSYFDSNFIPGCESWMFEDEGINAEININADGDDDESADEANAEALAQSAELEQEGGEIERADQMLSMQMYAGFEGYMTLARMQNYLNRGGNRATLEALFDMRTYLPSINQYVYGNEAFKDSVKGAYNRAIDFIKRIWRGIVTIFQRLIPWFGQNLHTLTTRFVSCRKKYKSITSNRADNGFKNYDGDKKVVDGSDYAKAFRTIVDLLNKAESANTDANIPNSSNVTLSRNGDIKSYTYDKLGDLISTTGKTLSAINKVQNRLDKDLNDSKKSLKEAEDKQGVSEEQLKAARDEATLAKKRATFSVSVLRSACKVMTNIFNDIDTLLKVASKGSLSNEGPKKPEQLVYQNQSKQA